MSPASSTVEMVCERLGELGLPVGPDTARELIRAILEFETPRVEAHVRDAIETSLDTIRIATQSALGVLAATERLPANPVPPAQPKPVLDAPLNRKTPAQGHAYRQPGRRCPSGRRENNRVAATGRHRSRRERGTSSTAASIGRCSGGLGAARTPASSFP